MKSITLTAAALLVAGCVTQATPPTDAELKTAKMARRPVSIAQAQKEIENHLKKNMVKPDTAQFDFAPPVNNAYTYLFGQERKIAGGWFICGTYTGENRLGYMGNNLPFLAQFDPATGNLASVKASASSRVTDAGPIMDHCNKAYGREILTEKSRTKKTE